MMLRKIDRMMRPVLLNCLSPARAMGLPIPMFFAKHLHFKGVVKVPLGNGKSFKMQSHGHTIENKLYWYGKHGHEPESFIPWLAAATQANVVLDIGANTAMYSLGAAAQNPGAQVFAFEPLPRVASLARHNVSLNQGFDIKICEMAVSDVSQQVTLHDPGGDQPSSASLKSDFLDCEQSPITVEAVRIDDFVASNNLPSVDLIKLDVEGIEELALRGMAETIRKFKPTLFIEVLDAREALMDELQVLVDQGYEVGDLTRDGVVPIDFKNANRKDRNLLLTPNLAQFTA